MKCKSLSFTIEIYLIHHIMSFSELLQLYLKVDFLPWDFNPILCSRSKIPWDFHFSLKHNLMLFLNVIAYLLIIRT